MSQNEGAPAGARTGTDAGTDEPSRKGNENAGPALIRMWIQKFSSLLGSYAEKLHPEVGEIWHSDEMTANLNGHQGWIWNLLDAETRFLLASRVSHGREIGEAKIRYRTRASSSRSTRRSGPRWRCCRRSPARPKKKKGASSRPIPFRAWLAAPRPKSS